MEIAEIHGPQTKSLSFKLLPAEPKKPTTSASTARVKTKNIVELMMCQKGLLLWSRLFAKRPCVQPWVD
jgi:hypothetical protein